jgi:hypothetical protein
MSRQFRRTLSAVIGTGSQQITVQGPGAIDAEGNAVEGLRMRFEIEKTTRSSFNTLQLEIYNLKQSTRARLEENSESLLLVGGYADNPQTIYDGQIRRSFSTRDGPDWVTTVHGGDQYAALRQATISKSYAAGQPVKLLLQEVAESFGLTVAPLIQNADDLGAILGAYSMSGSSAVVMDTLTESYGLKWAVQDGRLEVVGALDTINDTAAVVISPATGMIGSPVVTDAGVEVNTLMNPLIRPWRRIKIISDAEATNIDFLQFRKAVPVLSDGTYPVASVRHRGDTRANEWVSEVTTRPQNGIN